MYRPPNDPEGAGGVHTTLLNEYESVSRMGLNEQELLRLAQMSFDYAFSDEKEKTAMPHSSR